MKFSLIYEAQTTDASREGDHRVFKETVEQALLAEQVGFDTIWCVEHTSLTNYAHMTRRKPSLRTWPGARRASGSVTASCACRRR